MRTSLIIVLMMLLGLSFFSAQSRSDFKLRVENSFLKLYENPDVALHAAKEIRNDENALLTKDILTRAYLMKGDYLESVRDAFEKSSTQNSNQKLLSTLIIAREFFHLSLYEQTAKLIEPVLLEKNKSKKEEDEGVYAKLYQLEARNLIALKKLDKAEKNLQISSDYAQTQKSSFALILKENRYLKATLEFEKGNIAEALKISDQLLIDLKSIPRAKYLFAITQQLRGQLFFEQQKYEEAIDCFQRALKLIDKINYTSLKSNLYEDLAKNYLVVNNDKEFKFYKDQYRETSKILEENKKEARRELILLSTELNTADNKTFMEKKQNQVLYICGISIFVLSLLTYIFIREVQRGKSLIKQIRFFRSIKVKQNEPVKVEVKTKEVAKKQLIIPKETEQQILQGLQEFEESKKYLDNNMSLATLAVELETNTKYLSEIINKYKDKNFNTYINELRIKYVIHLLSTDRSYLQYKISYIAEIGGFTSHSAFTNVFKIITGMSPQEYMQTLRTN